MSEFILRLYLFYNRTAILCSSNCFKCRNFRNCLDDLMWLKNDYGCPVEDPEDPEEEVPDEFYEIF